MVSSFLFDLLAVLNVKVILCGEWDVVEKLTNTSGDCGVMSDRFPPVGNTRRIQGGDDATTGMFPWQVSLLHEKKNNDEIFCGGALIAASWVMTARHCIENKEYKGFALVFGASERYGIGPLSKTPQTNQGGLVQLRRDYDLFPCEADRNKRILVDLDMALIHFWPRVVMNERINHVCLSPWLDDDIADHTVYVSGRGRKCNRKQCEYTKILQYAELETITNRQCYHMLDDAKADPPYPITHYLLCAVKTEVPGAGACMGDSGGPLVIHEEDNDVYYLVGTVRGGAGLGCGRINIPQYFNRVHMYLGWVEDTIIDAYEERKKNGLPEDTYVDDFKRKI